MEINAEDLQRQAIKLGEKYAKLGKNLSSTDILESLGLQAKNAILLRTGQGKAVDGSSFKGYSSAYAKKEGKSTVNLQASGYMLRAMTQAVMSDGQSVKIFFLTNARPDALTNNGLARIHDQLGAGKSKVVRHFFGINFQDISRLISTFRKFVNEERIRAGL